MHGPMRLWPGQPWGCRVRLKERMTGAGLPHSVPGLGGLGNG
jgi:hypothetical protein